MIRAILFDIRALMFGPAGADFLSEVLRAEGISSEPIEVTEALGRLPEELRQLRAALQTEEQENDYYRAMIGPLLKNLGVPYPTDALLMRLLENIHEYHAYYSLYPEVLPVLHELQNRGFKLGVAANWEPSLARLLREFEIDSYFAAVVSSLEIGAAKPDPFLFRRALQLLEVGPVDAIHVGPGFEEDVTGAIRAGIRPVWLNRTGIPTGHDVLAIEDLRGLLLLASKAGH